MRAGSLAPAVRDGRRAARMFAVDPKPVGGAPGDRAGAAVPDPVGAVRNLLSGHNDLMAYGAYLAAKDAGRL